MRIHVADASGAKRLAVERCTLRAYSRRFLECSIRPAEGAIDEKRVMVAKMPAETLRKNLKSIPLIALPDLPCSEHSSAAKYSEALQFEDNSQRLPLIRSIFHIRRVH
jgi:hypothetical protein